MTWTVPAFEEVARLVTARTGMQFAHRSESVEHSISRAMARVHLARVDHFLERLHTDDRAFDDLVSDLTIGETYFFREPDQFEHIRREILPAILKQRGPGHHIRAWSAACATGEEAYSLAMLFEEEGVGEQSHVLATDLSKQALARARHGVFGVWSFRGPNGQAAHAHLTRMGEKYRVHEALHRRVTFAPLNLVLNVYPSFMNGTWGMDLIMCRNVLIYFDAATVKGVADRLFQCLVDGGWLIIGAADPPLWDAAPFEVVHTEAGIFYRRPRQVASGEWRVVRENTTPESWKEEEEVQPADVPSAPSVDPLDDSSPQLPADPVTLESVRALANADPEFAQQQCAQELQRFPFAPEWHYLHAILLLNLDREAEAIEALQRVLYLDRTLAVAHLTLASMLRRQGDLAGARRAYRNARNLCAARPPDDMVPLAEGESAGRLAEVAGIELALLEEGA